MVQLAMKPEDSFANTRDLALRRVRQSCAASICEFLSWYVDLATRGREILTVAEVKEIAAEIVESARRIGGIDE
jgi:hypothetical protein